MADLETGRTERAAALSIVNRKATGREPPNYASAGYNFGRARRRGDAGYQAPPYDPSKDPAAGRK